MTKPVVHIAFLDVGQGDTIVISVPETQDGIIVDCADVSITLEYLKHAKIARVRALFITHLHFDHCKDVISLLENQLCERVFFDFPKLSYKQWEILGKDDHSGGDYPYEWIRDFRLRLLNWKKRHAEQYRTLAWQIDMPTPLPESLQIIHPKQAYLEYVQRSSLNNSSAVLKVLGTKTSALLTGDLEPGGWQYLLSNLDDKDCLKSNVLKFPHHGAWIENNPEDIFELVQPSVVVVSVGSVGAKYAHPNQKVLDSLRSREGTKLLCTQATTKCSKQLEIAKRSITKEFKKDSSHTNSFFHFQAGCPCAGTVIVELGETVRIVQPSPELHKKIINENFSPSHQCNP